jgi:hypothetical protein
MGPAEQVGAESNRHFDDEIPIAGAAQLNFADLANGRPRSRCLNDSARLPRSIFAPNNIPNARVEAARKYVNIGHSSPSRKMDRIFRPVRRLKQGSGK